MLAAELPIYRYLIDIDDQVVWVNGLWLAFARENGAAQLNEATVLGKSLWDFFADHETSKLYKELHHRARLSGKPMVVPFRCDSPSLQRHMRLTITCVDDDQLRYESVLIRVEPQRLRLNVLNPEQPRSESFLTICSCCKRALLESTGWLELEDISVRLRLFELEKVPELHHTMCPDCLRQTSDVMGNGNSAEILS